MSLKAPRLVEEIGAAWHRQPVEVLGHTGQRPALQPGEQGQVGDPFDQLGTARHAVHATSVGSVRRAVNGGAVRSASGLRPRGGDAHPFLIKSMACALAR